MLLVPTGIETCCSTVCISRSLSDRQIVAAPPDGMLVRMYFISCDSCFHLSASCCVAAAPSKSASVILVVALSDSVINLLCSPRCRPMYA